MMTPAPLAVFCGGRYTVIDGLWMLEMRRTSVVATTSAAVLPSEPGASPGQRAISFGVSAAQAAVKASSNRYVLIVGFLIEAVEISRTWATARTQTRRTASAAHSRNR